MVCIAHLGEIRRLVGEILPLNWSNSSASVIYGTITEAMPITVTGFALVILLQNRTISTPVTNRNVG